MTIFFLPLALVALGVARATAQQLPVDTIYGVNLGNWLVDEKWMSGNEWINEMQGNGTCTTFDLSRKLGDGADLVFKKHWSTWFNDSDVQRIKNAGLNTVRIPLGFWLVEDLVDRTQEYFPRGGMLVLQKALASLKAAGIHAILDHHALPGAAAIQQEFAGQCTPNPQFYTPYNYQRALTWAAVMTALAHLHPDFGNTFAIQAINEPLMDASQTPNYGNYQMNFVETVRAMEQALGVGGKPPKARSTSTVRRRKRRLVPRGTCPTSAAGTGTASSAASAAASTSGSSIPADSTGATATNTASTSGGSASLSSLSMSPTTALPSTSGSSAASQSSSSSVNFTTAPVSGGGSDGTGTAFATAVDNVAASMTGQLEVQAALKSAIPIVNKLSSVLSFALAPTNVPNPTPLFTNFMNKGWQYNNGPNPADAARGPQAYDAHSYLCYSDDPNTQNEDAYLSSICNSGTLKSSAQENNAPLWFGEWSLCTTPEFTGSADFPGRFADAQKLVYSQSSGWIFWNFKYEGGSTEWDYFTALDKGYFTADPSKLNDPNVCDKYRR